jgi:hypothetical protein
MMRSLTIAGAENLGGKNGDGVVLVVSCPK